MLSRGVAATVAFLVLGCVVSGVVCSDQDGLPRPPNFPDAPTMTYGATPALTDSTGVPVDCQWYGWANTLYDAATGAACLDVLRMALTNVTVNPPADLKPYTYYTIKRLIDPANNQSYCYEGCYNLATSASPASSPAGVPLAPATTPTVDAPPPTLSFSPAGSPPAPAPVASTPAMEPGSASPPAPSNSLPPTSGAVSPPSPPTVPTTINLNGGTFVAPSAILLSCFVAGVALILNLAGH